MMSQEKKLEDTMIILIYPIVSTEIKIIFKTCECIFKKKCDEICSKAITAFILSSKLDDCKMLYNVKLRTKILFFE